MPTISREQRVCSQPAEGSKAHSNYRDPQTGAFTQCDDARWPEEVELFFQTERPKMPQDVACRVNVVVPDIGGGAEEILQRDVLEAKKAKNSDYRKIGITGREDTQASAEIEFTQADFPGFISFTQ
jgi:hypothetical protein